MRSLVFIIIYTVDQTIDPHGLQYLKTTRNDLRNDPLQGALTQARCAAGCKATRRCGGSADAGTGGHPHSAQGHGAQMQRAGESTQHQGGGGVDAGLGC